MIEKKLGEAFEKEKRNRYGRDIFNDPKKNEKNGPPTLLDHLILGTIVLGGISSLIYFFFFRA